MSVTRTLMLAAACSMALSPAAFAQVGKATSGEKLKNQAESDVPHCTKSLGTLALSEEDSTAGWRQYQLESPAKLLTVIVQRSGCFTLVDRGAGLRAAQQERDLAGGLGLQRGSNVGQGQVKAADYVLVPDVVTKNNNSGGASVGAALGSFLPGGFGVLAGGIRAKNLEANTVLRLTNVRTTEAIAEEGYAKKTDVGFSAGGGGWGGGAFGGVGGGGYENTDIGKIVTIAFIDAYSRLVNQLGGLSSNAAAAAPQRAFTVASATTLRGSAAPNGKVVRALPAGMTLYPTGNKDASGAWWEVADDNDNVGWVQNEKLTAAK